MHILGEAKALDMPVHMDFMTGQPVRIPPLFVRDGETVFEIQTMPGKYELCKIIR